MSTPILNISDPQKLLKMAREFRNQYIKDVAMTREKLDPARLRGLNASIKRLKQAINNQGG